MLANENSELLIDTPLNKYGWTSLHAACYFGHLDIVDYLVTKMHADVNVTNSNGWHSLIFAVYGRHLDVVDFLIYETSVNMNQRVLKNGWTAHEIAEHLEDRELVELFNEWEGAVSVEVPHNPDSLLTSLSSISINCGLDDD